MKIAISGKGGTGKTFVAGSLAAFFVQGEHPVIAIDADPSPNRALTPGLSPGKAAAIVPIAGNGQLIRCKTATEHPGVFRLAFTGIDIPRDHMIPAPPGMHLMGVGNRISGQVQETSLRTFAAAQGIAPAGLIPFGQRAYDSGIDGTLLEQERSPALHGLGRIAAAIDYSCFPMEETPVVNG